MKFSALGLVALALFIPLIAWAQLSNASISGVARDNTGAVIPGVKITAVNEETGVQRNAETNNEGRYLLSDLLPGTYKLIASFAGFKQLEREGVVLRVGDRVALDLAMEVGTQTERITVVGEVPLLRTEDAETGLVIDSRRIQELPSGRNPLALVHLAPNVNGTADQGGWSTDLRINGGRTAQVEYVLNGIPVTTGFHHDVPAAVPSMEAVSEIKVLTNGFSAEFGRLSGGAVTVVTRAGTNVYRGRVYDYFRSDRLNATPWNTNRLGGKKPPSHSHNYGANLGGPVRIPGLYSGRDRTFFFVDYETTRSTTGGSIVQASVPSMLERQGDFSQSLLDRGKPVSIFDPTTGRREGTRIVRDPFPGNRIPAARINPVAKTYMNHFPEPNRAPLALTSNELNFIGAVATTGNPQRWTGRLDQNWSSRHVTQFNVGHYYLFRTQNRWLSPLQEVPENDTYSWTGSLSHTWTLSPNTLITLRGGAVRHMIYESTGVDPSIDISGWGFQQEVINLLGTYRGRVPKLERADAITALGGGKVTDFRDTSYSGSASFQKLLGRHTIKFGYEHRRYYINTPAGGNLSMSLDRANTSRTAPTDGTGSGLASFLLGLPNSGGGAQYAGPACLQTYHGAFLQNDFKASSKLTLNLGVRWDFEPPMTERFNRVYLWDPDYRWDWKPSPGWSWDAVLRQMGGIQFQQPEWLTKGIYGRFAAMGTKDYPQRTIAKARPYQLGPKVGFAWQFLPKTVMRGGYGVNYLTMTGLEMLNGAPWNVGYGDLGSLLSTGSLDGGLTYVTSLQTPFPQGGGYVRVVKDTSTLNAQLLGGGISLQETDQNPGMEHVVHLGIQREVGSGAKAWVFEIAYSGNFGRKLAWPSKGLHIMPNAYYVLGPLGDKLNTMVSNPFYGQIASTMGRGAQQLRFGQLFVNNPLYGDIWTFGAPGGIANYNAGYLQAEHRFGKGFTFLANYTISKLLNDVGTMDGQFAQGRQVDAHPQAGLPLGEIYSLAKTDISQKLLINYLFELPVGRGKLLLGRPQSQAAKVLQQVVGGWHVAGTSTFRTGTPVVIELPRTAPGRLGGNWWNINQGKGTRPRFTGQPYHTNVSGHTAFIGAPNFQFYFNPKAFRAPEGMEIGDIPSSMPDLRGPSFSQWDLTIMKDFRLRERNTLQLRCEATNLLNHVNAGMPDSDLTRGTFGVIQRVNGSSRTITVAAKLSF